MDLKETLASLSNLSTEHKRARRQILDDKNLSESAKKAQLAEMHARVKAAAETAAARHAEFRVQQAESKRRSWEAPPTALDATAYRRHLIEASQLAPEQLGEFVRLSLVCGDKLAARAGAAIAASKIEVDPLSGAVHGTGLAAVNLYARSDPGWETALKASLEQSRPTMQAELELASAVAAAIDPGDALRPVESIHAKTAPVSHPSQTEIAKIMKAGLTNERPTGDPLAASVAAMALNGPGVESAAASAVGGTVSGA